tara:strand:- start:12 stop:764 length:753 start_codon:yes stop_codon:yes gene_type:complete
VAHSLTFKSSSKDNLFARRIPSNDFVFDDRVADVFEDMIVRSVPGYKTIISMIGVFAERYHQPGSQIYDLGCSLGQATFKVCEQLEGRDFSIIAIDNSEPMIKRLEKRKAEGKPSSKLISIRCEDINDTRIEEASVVILNFTLQFLPLKHRYALIKKIYEGLLPGGVLVMSEKIVLADDDLNDLLIDMYHRFKESKGYSKLEISQKRLALENVLTPESIDAHRHRSILAGFRSFEVWFQCFNFASMLAIK